jgi:hypothetical protein
MSLYARFICVDREPVTMADLVQACAAAEGENSLLVTGPSTAEWRRQGRVLALLEINVPGDEVFESEIEELAGFVRDSPGAGKQRVLKCLERAGSLVAAEVLAAEEDGDEAHAALAPLWQWLAGRRTGLVQIDMAGYYAGRELLLAVD